VETINMGAAFSIEGVLTALGCGEKSDSTAAGRTGPQCHLVFRSENAGMFETHWTLAPVESSLAVFYPGPGHRVPEHYYTYRNGVSEVTRGCGTPSGKRAFFEAWVAFLKMAQHHEGTFRLLANESRRPVAIYLNRSTEVSRVHLGAPAIDFDGVQVVAVVPEGAEFVASSMALRHFQQSGNQLGATCVFLKASQQGGACDVGAPEVVKEVDAVVRKRSSSFRCRRASGSLVRCRSASFEGPEASPDHETETSSWHEAAGKWVKKVTHAPRSNSPDTIMDLPPSIQTLLEQES